MSSIRPESDLINDLKVTLINIITIKTKRIYQPITLGDDLDPVASILQQLRALNAENKLTSKQVEQINELSIDGLKLGVTERVIDLINKLFIAELKWSITDRIKIWEPPYSPIKTARLLKGFVRNVEVLRAQNRENLLTSEQIEHISKIFIAELKRSVADLIEARKKGNPTNTAYKLECVVSNLEVLRVQNRENLLTPEQVQQIKEFKLMAEIPQGIENIQRRTPHCRSCKKDLHSWGHKECPKCGWLICDCGYCICQ